MRAVCEVFEPSAMPELAVGRGQPELGEEHRRQLVVEVLAGVDQHLLVRARAAAARPPPP